ncbi:MAG: hypothetical protein ABI596_12685 [Pyrinomonadaceae bacterium]
MHSKIRGYLTRQICKWTLAGALLAVFLGPSVSISVSAQDDERLREGTLTASQERLYAYDSENGQYPNIFREQGRIIALVLVAQHRKGKYTDDKMGVYEIKSDKLTEGWEFPIQVGEFHRDVEGLPIKVTIENRKDVLWFSVSFPRSSTTGIRYEAPVKSFYSWRLKTAARGLTMCGGGYYTGYQPGTVGAYTLFDPDLSRYLHKAPPDNFKLMAPVYVVPVTDSKGRTLRGRMPIADTGCALCHFEGKGTIGLCPQ